MQKHRKSKRKIGVNGVSSHVPVCDPALILRRNYLSSENGAFIEAADKLQTVLDQLGHEHGFAPPAAPAARAPIWHEGEDALHRVPGLATRRGGQGRVAVGPLWDGGASARHGPLARPPCRWEVHPHRGARPGGA